MSIMWTPEEVERRVRAAQNARRAPRRYDWQDLARWWALGVITASSLIVLTVTLAAGR